MHRRGHSEPIRCESRGFTLIEWVVVIVLLGILAAFVVPRFVSLSADAWITSIRGLGASNPANCQVTYERSATLGQPPSNSSVTTDCQTNQTAEQHPAAKQKKTAATEAAV